MLTNAAVTSLVQADGYCFASGLLSRSAPPARAVLRVCDTSGETLGELRAMAAASDEPGRFTFGACGVLALLPRAVQCRLLLTAADGAQEQVDCGAVSPRYDSAAAKRSSAVPWRDYLRRGRQLLRAGRLRLLLRKASNYLHLLRALPASHRAISRYISARAQGGLVLIIDHGLGGGAGQYLQRQIELLLGDGCTALILSPQPLSGRYRLLVRSVAGQRAFSVADPVALLSRPDLPALRDVWCNTATHFPRPVAVVAAMILLSWRSSARLRVLLHDYFSLCPSHFLLNAQGQYCGVPTLRQCARCLPHNPLVALASYRRHDMAAWRGMWAAVFGAAQEVVVFSNSSAGLLRKVYAREIAGKLSLRPHRVDDLPRPRIGSVSPLHIGVVGQIGVHKGAGLIAGLAREIRARHSPVRISVLGLLESDLEGRFAGTVAQTGPYRRRELPQLVQKTGVNVMLFPSICPETFSYVVQEIIEMELPLACLNLGAQAERVGTYRRGLLLPSAEPGAVLDALLDFHRRLYPDGQRAADG